MWEKVVLNLLSNALKFTFDGRHHRPRCARSTTPPSLTVERHRHRRPGRGAAAAVRAVPPRRASARAGPARAAASAWRWCASWWRCTAARSPPRATPDVGTTFTVTLPFGSAHLPAEQRGTRPSPDGPAVSAGGRAVRRRGPALAARDAGRRRRPAVAAVDAAGRAAGAPGRVLVADDNADMRELPAPAARAALRASSVSDGQAALEAALADPPDLVVSDVMMPRLDGMQLLAALRADARTARVPVVLLSARAGQEAAVEGLAAGADDYLVKPFSAQELLARVGRPPRASAAPAAQAEERFTAMADLAPALIWVADPDGRRVFLNAGLAAVHRRVRSARSSTAAGSDRLHPEDQHRYRERWRAAAEPARRPWEVEFRLRRSDGAYHWLLERAVPARRRARASPGYVGSCTDINARYRETERQTPARRGRRRARPRRRRRRAAGPARPAAGHHAGWPTPATSGASTTTAGSGPRGGGGGATPPPRPLIAVAGPQETYAARQAVETGRSVLQHGGARGRRHRSPLRASRSSAARRQQLSVSSGAAVPLTVRGRVLAVLGLGRRPDAPGFNEDDLRARRGDRRAGRAGPGQRAAAGRRAGQRPAGCPCCSAPPPRSRPRRPRPQVAVGRREHIRQLLGPRAARRPSTRSTPRTARSPRSPSAAGRPESQPAAVAQHPALGTGPPTTLAVHRAPRRQWFEDLDAWLATHPRSAPGAGGEHARLGHGRRTSRCP